MQKHQMKALRGEAFLTLTLVALMGVATFTGCADQVSVGVDVITGSETNCSDGEDNDGDDLVDCADPDCSDSVDCGGTGSTRESNCSDGVDNDNDGYTDCDDSDCAGNNACQSSPPTRETVCDDGCDNDGDGYTDCDDSDCAGNNACQPDPIDPQCVSELRQCSDPGWDHSVDDGGWGGLRGFAELPARSGGTSFAIELSGGCYLFGNWGSGASGDICVNVAAAYGSFEEYAGSAAGGRSIVRCFETCYGALR